MGLPRPVRPTVSVLRPAKGVYPPRRPGRYPYAGLTSPQASSIGRKARTIVFDPSSGLAHRSSAFISSGVPQALKSHKPATNCPAQRPCARRRPPLTPLALPFAIHRSIAPSQKQVEHAPPAPLLPHTKRRSGKSNRLQHQPPSISHPKEKLLGRAFAASHSCRHGGRKKQGGECICIYTVKPVTDYVIVCQ